MNTIGDLIKTIAAILDDDLLEFNFDFRNKQIIITFGEAAVPILIHPVREFIQGDGEIQGERTAAAAELYSELLRDNLCAYEINKLNKIIELIEQNIETFESYLDI